MFLKSKKRRGLVAFVSVAVLAFGAGLAGLYPANSASKVEPDYAYLKALGWEPMKGTLPNLACTDKAYADALKKGVKLGVYDAAPYMYKGKDGKLTGIDYEINVAVMKYIGITKWTNVQLQWPEMIPALVSKRIDVIAGDIHENPQRLQTIAFTTPAWWYGTVLVVKSSNSKNVKTWADLQTSGTKVGAITGSFTAEYLGKLTPKVDLTLFADSNTEFTSLAAGKVDVLVEDAPKAGEFIQANPSSGLKILPPATSAPPVEFQDGDAKFAMRPADCTLIGAWSRGLAELRDHGVITTILKKYGLGDGDNLFMPAYKP